MGQTGSSTRRPAALPRASQAPAPADCSGRVMSRTSPDGRWPAVAPGSSSNRSCQSGRAAIKSPPPARKVRVSTPAELLGCKTPIRIVCAWSRLLVDQADAGGAQIFQAAARRRSPCRQCGADPRPFFMKAGNALEGSVGSSSSRPNVADAVETPPGSFGSVTSSTDSTSRPKVFS